MWNGIQKTVYYYYYYNAIAIIIDKIKEKATERCVCMCVCGCVYITDSITACRSKQNKDNEKCVSEGIECNANEHARCCIWDEVLNTFGGKMMHKHTHTHEQKRAGCELSVSAGFRRRTEEKLWNGEKMHEIVRVFIKSVSECLRPCHSARWHHIIQRSPFICRIHSSSIWLFETDERSTVLFFLSLSRNPSKNAYLHYLKTVVSIKSGS